MRAGRLLTILLLLQTRGRMTAHELAGRLEVSVRTVYRDMEALGAAGVPLYGEPGRDGGYRLLDGFRTRLTGLTADEAQSLFLTGLPGPAAELGFGPVVAAAQLKLSAALPADLRDRAARVRERFHLDAPGWYEQADPAPHLAAVADAVWNERALRVRYRRWAEPREVDRTIRPLGLVLKSGRWYLVARQDGGGGVWLDRTYRVAQILALETLDDRFTRPDGFDLARHWEASLDEFEARLRRGEAVVRLSPEALRRFPDLMDARFVRAAEETAGPPDADGWREVVLPMESPENTASELLRLGPHAEVTAPPALRALMSRAAADLIAIYGRPAGDGNPAS